MNMKKLTLRVLPILLILCMVFSACTKKECVHANTELRNAKAASCVAEGYTGDVVCRDCGVTVTAGTAVAMTAHTWGGWTVVKNATALEPGSRTHTCNVCGLSETAEIAVLKPIDFNSASELIEVIYTDLLGGQSGTLVITPNETSSLTVTMSTVNDSLVGSIVVSVVLEDGTEKDAVMAVYYCDGAAVFYSNVDANQMQVTDLDAILGVPFDALKDVYGQMLDYIDVNAVASFEAFRVAIQDFITENGELFDQTMQQMGSAHTAEELMAIADSMETVYAYMALRLGIETDIEIVDTVVMPTRQDWLNVLEGFTTKTETADGAVYTFDAAPVLDSMKAAFATAEEICEMTLADYAYTVLAPTLTETHPELTDWAALEAYIRANVTGDTVCGDLIDKMITAVEANGTITVEELYALIDQLVMEQTGEEFDSEAMLKEYYELTLDEFVAMVMEEEDATLAALYDQISASLKGTLVGQISLGETEQGEMLTLADLVATYKAQVDAINVNALGFTVTVDAQGNLLAINFNGDVSMTVGEEAVTLLDATVTLKRDDTVTVAFPEHLRAVLNNRVNATYDANGNLVISGVGNLTDPTFDLDASGLNLPIADAVEKNAELSAEYGFDVYQTKAEYLKEDDKSPDFYALVNGTYISFYGLKTIPDLASLETLKISDDLTIYVKGTGFIDDEKCVYGYLPLSEKYCVWVACRYEGESIAEILYYGAEDNYHVYLAGLYDINDYLTKNADGTYTVSAELFAALREKLTEDFTACSVTISATETVGDIEYVYYYAIGAFAVVGDVTELLGQVGDVSRPDQTINWYGWFENHGTAIEDN